MEIARRAGALGAEIVGVDFADPLDAATLAGVHEALLDHKVLLLRAPTMSPEQHMALGRQLGEIEVHAFFPNLGAGYEQVSVLDSDDGTTASMWHTDETFLEYPPMGTLTHAESAPRRSVATRSSPAAARRTTPSPHP